MTEAKAKETIKEPIEEYLDVVRKYVGAALTTAKENQLRFAASQRGVDALYKLDSSALFGMFGLEGSLLWQELQRQQGKMRAVVPDFGGLGLICFEQMILI